MDDTEAWKSYYSTRYCLVVRVRSCGKAWAVQEELERIRKVQAEETEKEACPDYRSHGTRHAALLDLRPEARWKLWKLKDADYRSKHEF